MTITPSQGVQAMLTMLALAEEWQDWTLYEALLSHIKEAGVGILKVSPREYLLQFPKEP